MYRLLIAIYLILSLAHLYASHSQSETLILVTKPLLLTLLSLWFYLSSRPLDHTFKRFVLLGLVFSVGGDTLLMLVENGPRLEVFFLLGLGSFLIAQLSYMYAFISYPGAKRGDIARRPWMGVFFLLYLIGILGGLWSDIPSGMKVPVVIYAMAIVSMATAAFNLRGLVLREYFLGLMAGVLLFVVSDSCIAINKFGQPLPYARLLIMSTYLLGQLLIAWNAYQISSSDQTDTMTQTK
jgi:uncharacterized membrane protein YhhN